MIADPEAAASEEEVGGKPVAYSPGSNPPGAGAGPWAACLLSLI